MQNETILILGGTGSLGNVLTSHFGPNNTVGVFSRDEDKQWKMKRLFPQAKYFIGDVRNKNSLVRVLCQFSPTIIIFAAAQKHIDVCEVEVTESIDTNIMGIRNLIEILQSSAPSTLHTLLFVSTDKACNPINVYGQCKAISEKLMQEASRILPKIKFVCVRYGNVINSRGSLIPLFREFATTRDNFPVIGGGMTRFFMSLPQAVNLIETGIVKGKTGETWIFVAPSLCIDDIARYFSETYNKPIVITDIRPGEKEHEELYSALEESKARTDGEFLVITHSKTKDYKGCHGFRSDLRTIRDYDIVSQHVASMIANGTFAKL